MFACGRGMHGGAQPLTSCPSRSQPCTQHQSSRSSGSLLGSISMVLESNFVQCMHAHRCDALPRAPGSLSAVVEAPPL